LRHGFKKTGKHNEIFTSSPSANPNFVARKADPEYAHMAFNKLLSRLVSIASTCTTSTVLIPRLTVPVEHIVGEMAKLVK
jgi:hypothetical protein